MGTASARVVSGITGDGVTAVEFTRITSTAGAVTIPAAGTTSSTFAFQKTASDTDNITFNVTYRVTATVDGNTETTEHTGTATFLVTDDWYTDTGTTPPGALPSNSNGAFVVGSEVEVTVPAGGRENIYAWVPSGNATSVRFTTSNPNIFYTATVVTDGSGDPVVVSNHTLLNLGSSAPGTYDVRVGRL